MTVSAWRAWAEAAGTLSADGPADGHVRALCLDSRRIEQGEDAVFFAVRGVWHDGHDYLAAAAAAGVRRFVVEAEAALPGCDVVVVADTVAALQDLARTHREAAGVPVVAVTGSNGKTIVKEWTAALLWRQRVHRSPRSFNSQVGVPLSVWGMQAGQNLSLIEAGISEPGEMAALRTCAGPQWGVLTHLGEAHAANFPSRSALIAEKLSLFEGCTWVALPGDCHEGVAGLQSRGIPVRTWGPTGDLRVLHRGEREVTISYEGVQALWHLPAPGELAFRNAMTAALTALSLGAGLHDITETLPLLPQVDRRMERLSGPHGTWIVSDAYANDWGALAFALRDLERLPTTNPRALILGNLPGSAHDPERLRTLLAGTSVEKVWLIGAAWAATAHFGDWSIFPSVDLALLQFGGSDPFEGYDVLVKGPFEALVPLLTTRGHVTSLTLDLDAVGDNIRAIRGQIRATAPAVPIDHPTRLIAVVKASGYGANGPALARALESLGVSHLAVACTEEGVELRRHGIALPIVVLNPDPATFEALRAHRLEPEIIGPDHLAAFEAGLDGEPWPVHVKLDTGMHRVGFTEAEVPALLERLQGAAVRVETVMSHLASAEDAEADGFTRLQFERFHRMADVLRKGTDRAAHPMGRHILNSAGLARFPEQALEYARVGIGMFGVQAGLTPALTFATAISQIRTVPAGEGVGYGTTDAAGHDRRIAVLPVGYADGYPRHLSNGKGRVAVRGQLVPVVGRVCMDMTLIDVTDVEGVGAGDAVVLFGLHPPLEEVARWADTIAYELIARIPARVARIHRGG